MQERDRKLARKELDEELKPFRRAGMNRNPKSGLLRAVRHAVGIPVTEIAGKMEVDRSLVFSLEQRELRCGLTLGSMARMADAMECKMVYGIVPKEGRTLEQLAELRAWEKMIGKKGMKEMKMEKALRLSAG